MTGFALPVERKHGPAMKVDECRASCEQVESRDSRARAGSAANEEMVAFGKVRVPCGQSRGSLSGKRGCNPGGLQGMEGFSRVALNGL
jgi:hypothetical protein